VWLHLYHLSDFEIEIEGHTTVHDTLTFLERFTDGRAPIKYIHEKYETDVTKDTYITKQENSERDWEKSMQTALTI